MKTVSPKPAVDVLAIYAKAKDRWDAGKETRVDELILAMRSKIKEQAQTIRDMAQAVSAANEKCAELARGSTVKS